MKKNRRLARRSYENKYIHIFKTDRFFEGKRYRYHGRYNKAEARALARKIRGTSKRLKKNPTKIHLFSRGYARIIKASGKGYDLYYRYET